MHQFIHSFIHQLLLYSFIQFVHSFSWQVKKERKKNAKMFLYYFCESYSCSCKLVNIVFLCKEQNKCNEYFNFCAMFNLQWHGNNVCPFCVWNLMMENGRERNFVAASLDSSFFKFSLCKEFTWDHDHLTVAFDDDDVALLIVLCTSVVCWL